jgi:hypothetical protein
VGPIDVVEGQPLVAGSGVQRHPVVVGRGDLAFEAARTAPGVPGRGGELDLDALAHGAGEVAGCAEPALEARTAHLEGVRPGDGIGLVESA